METKELFPQVEAYIKTFRMQATGADGQTTRVSVPRDVIKKEARKRGLPVKKFLKEYRIEWRYNSFDGAYALFVPVRGEKETTTT